MTKRAAAKPPEPAGARPIAARSRVRAGACRDDVATRRMILQAALEAFSLHGFEGASLASIVALAKSGRVSSPLIHYYFKNKENLWRSAVEFGLGDVLSQLREIIEDLDGFGHIQRLRFFIKRYIAIMADRPEVFQIIVRESETPGARLTWLAEKHLGHLYTMITDIIANAQGDGDIIDIAPPYHVAQIIIGACYHFIGSRNRMRVTYGIDVLARETRELHTRAVLAVVLNGLLSKAVEAGGGAVRNAPAELSSP